MARPAKPTARNQPGRETAPEALGRPTPFNANFPSPPPTSEASKGHHVNGFPGPKMPAGAYPPPRAVHHFRGSRGLRKIDAAFASRRPPSRLGPLRHDHAGARRHAGRREDPKHPPRHGARRTRPDRGMASARSGPTRARACGDPARPSMRGPSSSATVSPTRPRRTRRPDAASMRAGSREVDARVREGLTPDLTLVYDCDPQEGLARAKARNAKAERRGGRFEAEDLSLHEKVRAAFLAIARREPGRVAVIRRRRGRRRRLREDLGARRRKIRMCDDGARETRRGARAIPGALLLTGSSEARLEAESRELAARLLCPGNDPERDVRKLPACARRASPGLAHDRAGGHGYGPADPRRPRAREPSPSAPAVPTRARGASRGSCARTCSASRRRTRS